MLAVHPPDTSIPGKPISVGRTGRMKLTIKDLAVVGSNGCNSADPESLRLFECCRILAWHDHDQLGI